jgi:hypothetical protein
VSRGMGFSRGPGRGAYAGVHSDEDDDDDVVGVDLGMFAGGDFDAFTPQSAVDSTHEFWPPEHKTAGPQPVFDPSYGGAEFQPAESQPMQQSASAEPDYAGFSLDDIGMGGGLGAGMVGATMGFSSSSDPQGLSKVSGTANSSATKRRSILQRGQEEANAAGQMVAIFETFEEEEIEPVKMDAHVENYGDGGTLTAADIADLNSNGPQAAQKKRETAAQPSVSFVFPNYKAPNWKPISMRWFYISFLILFSLGLAVLQELLYQYSSRRIPTNAACPIDFVRPKCGQAFLTGDDEDGPESTGIAPPWGLWAFGCADDLSDLSFFLWKYAPVMIIVPFGMLWQVMDFEIKRLEPFYQLSREHGATAAESLNIDYLSGFTFLAPIKAIRYKQWAVVLSSFAALMASIVFTLQTSSFQLQIFCDNDKNVISVITVNSDWSRLTTACFGLTATLGLILLIMTVRRPTGVQSDPKGIAGIAAMANKSWILVDFKDLDRASEGEIHKQLQRRRYILRNSTIWQGEQVRMLKSEIVGDNHPHPMIMRLRAGIPFVIYMCVVTGIVPVLFFTEVGDTVLKKVPLLLSAMAVSVRLTWISLEAALRMMEPFYDLSRRHAPYTALTVDYRGTIPGGLVFHAYFHKNFLLAAVAFNSVLAEILCVTLTSISHGSNSSSATSTTNASRASLGISLGILISLQITAICVYVKRRRPFLPRQPGTIASVLAFIHQSNMIYDFIGTETYTGKQMNQYLRRKGKTYGLGWFRGRDHSTHCGVDEDDRLLKSYEHGVNYEAATEPWIGGGAGEFEYVGAAGNT